MGNLYDWFIALLGIEESTSGYNSNVIYCACICAIVLFSVGIKLIFRGFDKTTKYAQIAYQTSRMIDNGKCPFKYIIGNVKLTGIPHYYQISPSTLGMIGYPDALVLIDEGSIVVDSRDWEKNKKQSNNLLEYILLHRHWRNSVYFFTQIWNRLDKTIRDITDEVVYLHKGLIFRGWTRETIIRYGIMIPQVGQDRPGEIIMGYLKPTKIAQIVERRFWRRPYYKFFDSFEVPIGPVFRCTELGNLPASDDDL